MKNYKLTNRDINENFKDVDFYLNINDFKSAFAYWIVYLNPFGTNGVNDAIKAFEKYLKQKFIKQDEVILMKYNQILEYISSDVLASIPEIYKLNQTKEDFICLGALSHNIFYMILRLSITQPL